MDPSTYDLDEDTGTVVFDSAPAVQPTMTYYWSHMTKSEVVGILFAGFHEMEGRWPRRFKLVDSEGAEVLYPDDADNIYVVNQAGTDPVCGSDTFSTSAAERFLLLFPDVDLRFATNLVERIRQTMEMARLEYRKEEIRVTVSCAVTEVAVEDSPEKLYARAESTLREAKRYGRNRTFVHEGRYPTPVVPPNFTLKEKCVTV